MAERKMKGMADLPQEIYRQIAYLLEEEMEALYRLALTSKAWRGFATEVLWRRHGDTTLDQIFCSKTTIATGLIALSPRLTITDAGLQAATMARYPPLAFPAVHTLIFHSWALNRKLLARILVRFRFPNVTTLILRCCSPSAGLDPEVILRSLPRVNTIVFGRYARYMLLHGSWYNEFHGGAQANYKALDIEPFVDDRYTHVQIGHQSLETLAVNCRHQIIRQILDPSNTLRHLQIATRVPDAQMLLYMAAFPALEKLVIKYDGRVGKAAHDDDMRQILSLSSLPDLRQLGIMHRDQLILGSPSISRDELENFLTSFISLEKLRLQVHTGINVSAILDCLPNLRFCYINDKFDYFGWNAYQNTTLTHLAVDELVLHGGSYASFLTCYPSLVKLDCLKKNAHNEGILSVFNIYTTILDSGRPVYLQSLDDHTDTIPLTIPKERCITSQFHAMMRREHAQFGHLTGCAVMAERVQGSRKPRFFWAGPMLGTLEERLMEVSPQPCHKSLTWCLDCFMRGEGWGSTVRSGNSEERLDTLVGQ